MRFILKIDMRDDALTNDPQHELARILTSAAAMVWVDGVVCGTLRDVNGNTVGWFDVDSDAKRQQRNNEEAQEADANKEFGG